MEEYANGAAQVSIQLKDGRVFEKVLISNGQYVIAARGFDDLPFEPSEITRIWQSEDDRNPALRGNWVFWDELEMPPKP